MTIHQLKYILFLGIFIRAFTVNAQESLPEIGKPIKDFTFHDVVNYKTKTASLSEFRGKWLFLQFWYTGCTSNIKMYPTLKQYVAELHDRVNFVLIVPNHNILKKTSPSELAKVQRKFKTKFTVAFDSVLHRQLDIWAMPYFLLIDPNGIVRAMSDGRDVNINKLRQVLAGGKPDFLIGQRYSNRYEYLKYNSDKDSSILFRSALSKVSGERPSGLPIAQYFASPKDYPEGIIWTGTTLVDLYKMAYLDDAMSVKKVNGNWRHPYPVVEVTDKKFFEHDSLNLAYDGFYNYNLFISPSMNRDSNFVKAAMQANLRSMFDYNVTMEKREMPVWRLLSKPGAAEKLKTRGGVKFIWRGLVSITVRNVSVDTFRGLILYPVYNNGKNIFIDENELDYSGNIDVTFEALITDINEMQSALNTLGLYLRKEMVMMNVLVIRDAKEN